MEATDVSLRGNEPCSMRLYVGGLGPSVTSRDLELTFAALGRVSSVDLVRTKGRNFAYMNFEAGSPQDLHRFFSLYNGCTWKGGRLKLEKAREHYIHKLRREWEDRDCSTEASETSTSTSDSPSLTKKFSSLEQSKGLKIFFPKSRQVKTVPQKGLGKHKRSFECVDSFPCSFLQLCDCKQCCRGSCDENKLRSEKLELAGKSERKVWTKTESKVSKSTDTIDFKDPLKKYEMDSPQTKKRMVCFDAEKVNAEGTVGVPELSKPPMKVTARAERKSCHVIENMKSVTKPTTDIPQKRWVSFNSEIKEMQKSVTKPTTDIPQKRWVSFNSEINKCFLTGGKELSENRDELTEAEEGKLQADLATETLVENKELNSATDTVWLQKASWKTLLGERDHISFRLSNILGRSLDSAPINTNNRDNAKSFGAKSASLSYSQQPVAMASELKAQPVKINLESIPEYEAQKSSVAPCSSLRAGSRCSEGKGLIRSSPRIQGGPEEDLKELGEGTSEHYELELKQPTKLGTTTSTGTGNDKVCTFMRSTNSEQEWFKSKQIVKELMKRSRKDALRSIKMLRGSRQNY